MLQVDSQMYRLPDGNVVQFWERPVPVKHLSDAAGRPVFFKAVNARIISPAMKTQAPDQRVWLKDEEGKVIRRSIRYTNADTGQVEYWDDYLREPLKAWTEGKNGGINGTPLDTYPRLDVAQIAMLKVLGIHTLEQLADVPDAQLYNLGHGGRSMRDGVKAYLDAAKGNAPLDKLAADNAALKEQLVALQEQMNRLTTEPAKRGPGRPPKEAAAA